MAVVRLTDIITPEIFMSYFRQDIIDRNLMIQNGVIGRNRELAEFLAGGGDFVELPFWDPIDTSVVENISNDDPADLSVAQKITADKETAARTKRNQSWSAMRFAKYIAGSDPMRAILNQVVDYWLTRSQAHLLSMLLGVFADNVANDGSDMVNNIWLAVADPTSKLQRSALIKATHTSGDRFNEYNTIFIHSDVHEVLSNDDQIDTTIPASEFDPVVETYEGLTVQVDDSMPKVLSGNATEYTSYIFGPDAFSGEEGELDDNEALVIDRKEESGKGEGQDTLFSRRMYAYHPNGFAYQRGEGANPSNATIETAAAWDRKIDRKKIRIASVVHTV